MPDTDTRERFAERLQRAPLLSDGAMGIELYQRGGMPYGRCLDELNQTSPDLVKSVHPDYIRAGAELIETNTFGASRVRLAAHGLGARMDEINQAGVRLAREAQDLTGQRVWIAGAVGPLGDPLAPLGPIGLAQVRRVFKEQARSLAGAGVDLITLEPFADIKEIGEAVLAIREVCGLPIVAHMTFGEDGKTSAWNIPADVARTLGELDVHAIGANCSVGSEPMQRVLEEMAGATDLPLSALPNAGFPTYQDGRYIYRSSPEYVAQHARRMEESGATLVGCCCCTSPEHIAAVRDALAGARTSGKAKLDGAARYRPLPSAPRSPSLEPTVLSRKLGGKFVVTVEVDPPRGFGISAVLESLSVLRETGLVDAIDVADSPRAQSRMSSLAMCSLIQSRLGMETVMHVAIRHRNLVALHLDLLRAHSLGVRNVFMVMGDLPSAGDFPDATSISDITASDSIRLIKSFNSRVDVSSRPIEQATSFNVGCAFNIGAENMDRELKVLERKVTAGADFILTQPVYSAEAVEQVRRRLGGFPVPVLLGILPLRSRRHAEFLHNEVPRINVTDEVMYKMSSAGKRAPEVGIELCRELLRDVSGVVAGAYFMPPFGRYETVLEVLDGIELVGP